jgi:hypothetical protein
MATKRDIHVIPHDDGWTTKKEGAQRGSFVHERKTDALEQGRAQAKRDQVELVIHRRDGTIQDSDSYGKDPHPPKDKKR